MYPVLPLVGDVWIKMYTFLWLLRASTFHWGRGMCSVWPTGSKPFLVTIPHTLPGPLRKSQGAGFSSGTKLTIQWIRCQGLHLYLIKDLGLHISKTSRVNVSKRGPANCQHRATLEMLSPGPVADVLFWFLQIPSRVRSWAEENGGAGEDLLSFLPLLLPSPPSHRAWTAGRGGGWRLQSDSDHRGPCSTTCALG